VVGQHTVIIIWADSNGFTFGPERTADLTVNVTP
jgi:hypothetical protein